ncbi:AAA family ATPase [Arcicella rosea]|uniref:Putative ATPase n=1 Tax=Arcicella rosea TaxID=502909 RepID=A0A841ERG6_9BACT|nr:AAA family ATPase [Arcicella rosea]MBB6002850.1 putative ATPase [Arcicella rosea]
MLTGIKFKNYKAFLEGHLEIKPVTILLGANSVGKSSLIQLFLMLQETALAKNYKSALKLHGGLFSLGEGINLFRNKDSNNALHFEIEFNEPALSETIQRDFFDRYFDEVINFSYFIFSRLPNNNNGSDLKFIQEKFIKDKSSNQKQLRDIGLFGHGKRDLNKSSREDFISLITRTNDFIKKIKDRDIFKEITQSIFYFRSNFVGQMLLHNKDEIILTYDFLKKLQEIKNSEKVSIEYDFMYGDSALKIKNFKLKIGGFEIVNVNFNDVSGAESFITSDIVDFEKINSKQIHDFKQVFKNNKTVFSFIENYEYTEHNNSVFCFYFINFISQVINKLEESFNTQKINYVSPLRAHPKRYYFLDKAKANSFLDTLDGEAIAEILKEDSTLKESVNNWFKKFNLHIDVGPIKDIIHQIVVKQNSLDLDITDVGFGVSQVLPVIIQGFLSKERSITLVEQPEIHLHPKMQADLADLFIDIAVRKHTKKDGFVTNKYLIIETHSEYLLKRLRRRISENKITPDKVAIYYLEPQEDTKSAQIKRIDISEKGAFDWPKDFYTGDLADDITEFLRNQI